MTRDFLFSELKPKPNSPNIITYDTEPNNNYKNTTKGINRGRVAATLRLKHCGAIHGSDMKLCCAQDIWMDVLCFKAWVTFTSTVLPRMCRILAR